MYVLFLHRDEVKETSSASSHPLYTHIHIDQSIYISIYLYIYDTYLYLYRYLYLFCVSYSHRNEGDKLSIVATVYTSVSIYM